MKKTSGVAVQFLAILAAFFSSVVAKTEAGKNYEINILCCCSVSSKRAFECNLFRCTRVCLHDILIFALLLTYRMKILFYYCFTIYWYGFFDLWYLLICLHEYRLKFMSKVMFVYKYSCTCKFSTETDWLTSD